MATFRVTGGVLEGEVIGVGGPPSDAHPEHPIVIPIPPGGIDPGPPPVPAHPIYLPVYPAHPIVIPPDTIGPGVPTHPIVLPPYVPAHPIVIPPGAINPDPPVPSHPIVLPPPHPEHPIVLPPEPPVGGSGEGKWIYSPVYGWVWDPGAGGKPQPLP